MTLLAAFSFVSSQAQQTNYTGKKGNLYLSWGYNKEWYTRSNIHIKQPSLGNDYTFVKTKGVDKPGWNKDLLKQPISIPQYNYRVGYFFKDRWAVEINFDHTKFQVPDQTLRIKGTYHNRQVDSSFARTGDNMMYQLNNGANFLLFNLVHQVPIPYARYKNIVDASLLLKGGIGVVIPHVENKIMGDNNEPHFQLGGVDAGLEAALRVTLFKYAFLEYSNKVVYANYWGLRIYEGKARQAFGCYEMILSLGASIPLCKSKPATTVVDPQ